MSLKNTLAGRFASALAIAAVLALAGCAVKTTTPASEATKVAAPTPAPRAASAGTVLEYKMPAGRVLSYQDKTDGVEVTEVMGQSMESNTSSTSAFSFKGKGLKEKNLLLGATIDDMSVSVTSVQGDMSPDMKGLKGKTFDMVLSPLGAEVDVSGAEAITYEFATGTRNLASTFKLFFPDLPGKPLKVGDSWPSSYGTDENAGALKMRLDFQNVNTLEGFETVDGMECARISSKITGTISGSGNQMGMDMDFSGTHKGTDLWYFAVKEGIFVKSTSELTTEMSINVPAAGMTIPSTQTRKSEVKLVGRS
jgi:hypothetical protein